MAVSASNPDIRRTYSVQPVSGNVQESLPGGVFHEPRSTSRDGRYRISADTIVVVMADNDSSIWTGVRVSARWLIQTTDHGAIDFNGRGRTEWAKITYLYERSP